LTLTLDHLHSVKSTLLPLFVRVVELVSVFNGFGQALPLLFGQTTRNPTTRVAIERVLGHIEFYRGLTRCRPEKARYEQTAARLIVVDVQSYRRIVHIAL